MRYLLDTATWSNNALMPQVLPARIRKLLDTDEIKGVCGISLLELAILHRRGRLKLVGLLPEFFDRILARDIEVLDLTPAVAVATNELPNDFPGDPFDRVMAATARVLDLTLLTPDPVIRDAGFCKVEFYPFKPSRA